MRKAEYYRNLPKKSLASGVLLFSARKELLLVKPSYKDYWSIPGGTVEVGESPRKACLRECQEEIGIRLEKCELIAIDYYWKRGVRPENIQFLFYGGTLTSVQSDKIKVDGSEIELFRFENLDNAMKLVNPRLRKRIACALDNMGKGIIYLEEGRRA